MPAARARAFSWSSARRATIEVSAMSAALAITPAWRIPPPSILRNRRARAMKSAGPTMTEPTGAESPFERQTETESAALQMRSSGTPDATAALQMRAPSR
eukprot:Amastigsp_a179758_47.p3 type:complete len:100 gc:universal Amastigsp_a179758_47:853-554(-)